METNNISNNMFDNISFISDIATNNLAISIIVLSIIFLLIYGFIASVFRVMLDEKLKPGMENLWFVLVIIFLFQLIYYHIPNFITLNIIRLVYFIQHKINQFKMNMKVKKKMKQYQVNKNNKK